MDDDEEISERIEEETRVPKWTTFKGWHGEPSLWREIYARTISAIIAAGGIIAITAALGNPLARSIVAAVGVLFAGVGGIWVGMIVSIPFIAPIFVLTVFVHYRGDARQSTARKRSEAALLCVMVVIAATSTLAGIAGCGYTAYRFFAHVGWL